MKWDAMFFVPIPNIPTNAVLNDNVFCFINAY